MGFLDAILGRTKPVPLNLDALFAVSPAALTLEAALDLRPAGTGSVCFRTAEGPAAAATGREIDVLLQGDLGTRTTVTNDEYGYTWVTCSRLDADVPALVTDPHMVNSSLAVAGLGTGLLCTVLGRGSPAAASWGRRVAFVYL